MSVNGGMALCGCPISHDGDIYHVKDCPKGFWRTQQCETGHPKPKSEFQQLSEQIAALRDGLIKRADEQGAKLHALAGQIRQIEERLPTKLFAELASVETAIKGLESKLGGIAAVVSALENHLEAAAPKQKQRKGRRK